MRRVCGARHGPTQLSFVRRLTHNLKTKKFAWPRRWHTVTNRTLHTPPARACASSCLNAEYWTTTVHVRSQHEEGTPEIELQPVECHSGDWRRDSGSVHQRCGHMPRKCASQSSKLTF